MCKRSLWKDEEYNVESPGKRIRRENTFVLSTTTTIDIDNLELEEIGKIQVPYIYYQVFKTIMLSLIYNN